MQVRFFLKADFEILRDTNNFKKLEIECLNSYVFQFLRLKLTSGDNTSQSSPNSFITTTFRSGITTSLRIHGSCRTTECILCTRRTIGGRCLWSTLRTQYLSCSFMHGNSAKDNKKDDLYLKQNIGIPCITFIAYFPPKRI